jgi:heme-degrading monooxygenase HmoA
VTVYTLGVWKVQPGKEDEFVEAWHSFGQWTVESGFESHGTLLRDRADPSRFVSFGPWRSVEDAERWRSHPEFVRHLARIESTLESFEPSTFDIVLSVS